MKKITYPPSSNKPATNPATEKEKRVGRTGRRRAKEQENTSRQKGLQDNTIASKNAKVDVVASITSTTNLMLEKSNWLSSQLKINLESSPKFIPEELVVDPYFHIKDELQTISEANNPKAGTEDLNITEQYLGYLGNLDKIKKELGGAPNYFGSRPTLKPRKLLFGISVETVKFWISKAIKKHWLPKPLWRALGSYFNIENGMSHYEYLALTFQSLDQMKQNLSEIQARVLSCSDSCAYLNRITGLTYHNRLNNPKALAISLEDYLTMFEHQLERALRNNNLKEFLLEAMPDSDVCFEARFKSMIEYTSKNPLDEEGGLSLNLDLIADYTGASSVEYALNEELRLLLWHGKLENANRDSIREKLVLESQIVGKIFTGGINDSESFLEFIGREHDKKEIEVTVKIIDQYLDYAENILCIF